MYSHGKNTTPLSEHVHNDETINEFDRALPSFLRRVFDLNHSTTVRSMFVKKHFGGIGIRKPSIAYRTTRICHLFKMLNHPNENFRLIARNSLEIDFNKRGIKRSTENGNFLGYECKSNGDLATNIKGGFGLISDWSHLHHICAKLGLKLSWEHPEKRSLMDCGNACASFVCKRSNDTKVFITSKKLKAEIIDKQIYEELDNAKELPVQGRLLDNNNADYLLSQNIFRTYKLSDNLVQFWYKARHNVVLCNYSLSIWYPQQSPDCKIDGYHLESMGHILNGCKEFRNNYSTRHDTIVEKIASELRNVLALNKTVGSAFEELDLSPDEHPELNMKPDIVLWHENEVTIIDIACLYDLYIENLYQSKLEKYYCIRDLLKQHDYKCTIEAIIIGSLGTVHKKSIRCITEGWDG